MNSVNSLFPVMAGVLLDTTVTSSNLIKYEVCNMQDTDWLLISSVFGNNSKIMTSFVDYM